MCDTFWSQWSQWSDQWQPSSSVAAAEHTTTVQRPEERTEGREDGGQGEGEGGLLQHPRLGRRRHAEQPGAGGGGGGQARPGHPVSAGGDPALASSNHL